jgi:HEAT repeat protein
LTHDSGIPRKYSMSFYPELDQLNLEALAARFKMPAPEGEEYGAAYYSEVASLIARQGERGIAFLEEQLDKEDTARMRAILSALTEPGLEKPLGPERLVPYLADARPEIVAVTVDGLRRQRKADVTERVLGLLHHPSPYVRGSVLRFMAELHPDNALPLLIDALKDEHFIVRENAADELGELGRPEALPHLLSLLADPHPDVQQAAQTAIEILEAKQSDASGTNFQVGSHHL